MGHGAQRALEAGVSVDRIVITKNGREAAGVSNSGRQSRIALFPLTTVGPTICCTSDNLPAPEVIAREIVEDLTAALAEFAAVAAALEQRS